MKLRTLVPLVLGTALVLTPTAVSAKGPDGMELTGPGLDTAIRVDGGAPGSRQVIRLADAAGLYTAFGYAAADALSAVAPPGARGPRYVATYSMVENGSVRQHLYPFAEGGPLAYTPPDQSMYGTAAPGGGWQRVEPIVAEILVSLGVPTPAERKGWATVRDDEHRLSISYPPSWRPARSTVAPLLVDPKIPLALGTYDFPTEGCGAVPGPALDAMGKKDAFIAVYVYGDGATWAPDVSERPASFGPDLPWSEGPFKCGEDVRGTVRSLNFAAGGRQLDALIAFGTDASVRRQNQLYRILDTLTVEPAVD